MDLSKLAMFFFTILSILFLFNPMLITPEEVEDEHEFSYHKNNEHGPENWGMIHEEWAACAKGKMQSPIDLSNTTVTVWSETVDPLRRSYQPAPAVLKNRGHDIMLKWEGNAGSVWINGTEYPLEQAHWHSPSEHTINGSRFSLEMHMVHETTDNKRAVVGVLYAIGEPDEFLTRMEGYIKKLKDKKDEEENVGIVNPDHVNEGSNNFYRYMGSLTVPPCTEGVLWTILSQVKTLSKEQLNLLIEAVHDDSEMNARPVQQINDRTVEFYQPREAQ